MKPVSRQRGFTLVEMLVSLAIFAVITAFTTANFNLARQGDEVRLASQLMGSALRRAQSAATAGETVQICRGGANDFKLCLTGAASECPGGSCSTEVPYGFGIHLTTVGADNRKVVLYADTDNDRLYDVGEGIRFDSVSPGKFVSVTSLVPSMAGALDVFFAPPKPTTYYNAVADPTAATITVGHSTTNQLKTITINPLSGQISAQ